MEPFAKVRRYVKQHALLEGARGVVVAVSGGPDSVALLDMLARLQASIHIAHLNHQLRGRDSDEDAEFVRRLAERLGLPVTVECADVRAAAERARRGIEETARAIRYDFLRRVARATGADHIATGHTMSDQAETFLMRLARGAGTRGLVAMRPMSAVPACDAGTVSLIRPLLCITRSEVEAYCDARGLSYRLDATNLGGEYTRNRVRRDVLPAVQAINPRAVEAIARAAEQLAADEAALDELAQGFLDAARVEPSHESSDRAIAAYRVAALSAPPAGLRRRMLLEAARRARVVGEEITAKHVAALQSLLDEKMRGKRVQLPCGLEVWREFEALVFKRASEAADDNYAFELSAAQPAVEAGGLRLIIERGLPASQMPGLIEQAARLKTERRRDWLMAILDDEVLPASLVVCPRPQGARARLAGHQKTIKLKKLMIAHTIPVSRRATWPVVMTTDQRYVWSPGLPPAVDFAAHDATRSLAIVRASEPLNLCRSTDG
ncbi:MAG TPA: tRNA lysidine(34) synthetase TilS [Blastocatellia bacterium]|nr:tRNA lysidine(34) synthetase TilS [Blastocatellia bacterium]